jgi:hypothetical protein
MQQLLVVLLMRLEGLKVDFRTKAKDELFLRDLIVFERFDCFWEIWLFLRDLIFFGYEHQLYFDLYLEKLLIERSKHCNGELWTVLLK